MNLTLKRQSFNSWGIISELTEANGEEVAVTLEHAYQSPTGYLPKLPDGTYTCVLGTHQLSSGGPQSLYEITNVPGHQGILMHVGNYNRDSEGCVLVGTALGQECITGSKTALGKFMELQGGENFTLTVLS
jgi:hypothetical protein